MTLRQLKALYEKGQNISDILRKEADIADNTQEIVEISYDLQSGSYITAMENEKTAKYQKEYTKEIANTILSLCEPASVLEAGVGEATTLSGVIENLGSEILSFGFDLSYSRIAYAKKWLEKRNIANSLLCTGSLFNIPFLDSSFDVVYTSHSIEPNGGHEKAILHELYRVTRQFLVLLEPEYELASNAAKKRMNRHGYCKNLKGTADSLDYDVLEHKLFTYESDSLNPTALTIIRKNKGINIPRLTFACPKSKTPLQKIGGALFSQEALMVYPIIRDIPCLRVENGILSSKYEETIEPD